MKEIILGEKKMVKSIHLIAGSFDGHGDLKEHIGGLVGPLLSQV